MLGATFEQDFLEWSDLTERFIASVGQWLAQQFLIGVRGWIMLPTQFFCRERPATPVSSKSA
jgi:hypothetical protein